MSIRRAGKHLVPVVSLAAVLALSAGVPGLRDRGSPAEAAVAASSVHSDMHHAPGRAESRRVALYSTMRTLWDQHMQWTYDAVVAFATDSPGLQPTIDRLLRNQVDIGDAFEPYFGRAAANRLTELLTTHITDALPVLTAAKAGDQAGLREAVTAWYANADEIGRFLEEANPRWAHAGMPEMMKVHVTQTIGYATDVLGGDHAKAISGYDEAQAHMDEMADVLSAGIVARFPERF